MEEWRVIPEHPNYQVSNTGQVRCVKIYPIHPVEENKHLRVQITSAPNQRKNVSLARAVYSAFCGAIPDGYHVFHHDGDYTNNTPDNLFIAKRGYK